MPAVLTENGFIDTKADARSWIHPADDVEKFRVGDRVSIKRSARTYATGERIPNWVKARRHRIQQVATNRVLLREIYSWVRKVDVEK